MEQVKEEANARTRPSDKSEKAKKGEERESSIKWTRTVNESQHTGIKKEVCNGRCCLKIDNKAKRYA